MSYFGSEDIKERVSFYCMNMCGVPEQYSFIEGINAAVLASFS